MQWLVRAFKYYTWFLFLILRAVFIEWAAVRIIITGGERLLHAWWILGLECSATKEGCLDVRSPFFPQPLLQATGLPVWKESETVQQRKRELDLIMHILQ